MKKVRLKKLEELLLVLYFDKDAKSFNYRQGNGRVNHLYLPSYLALYPSREIEVNEWNYWEGIKILPEMIEK